jgi:hypothetical protein
MLDWGQPQTPEFTMQDEVGGKMKLGETFYVLS